MLLQPLRKERNRRINPAAKSEGLAGCRGQLNNFAQKARDFADSGINLIAIGTDSPAQLKKLVADSQEEGAVAFPLLSDAKLEVIKTYRCLDFDNQPMHGVFLIDAQGRIRSQRISDKPFTDTAFVLKEAKELSNTVAAR